MKHIYIFAIFIIIVFLNSQRLLSKQPPAYVTALAVYAHDSNDFYPFPSDSLRHDFYLRLCKFYETMSYGRHKITIKEALSDSGYFVSEHAADYYNQRFDRKRHANGFAMFNEEILNRVILKYGAGYFSDVDLIIMFGTDGGKEWYTRGVNATGYGALGFDFKVGDKVFGRQPGEGGINVEIGSDFGTSDPADDKYIPFQQIHWTLAHEYGHWLGLGHRNRNFGVYSLMSDELYGNGRMPAFGPPPLDIFHIMDLGWLDESDTSRVQIIASDVTCDVRLNQIRNGTGLVLLRVDIPGSREKFYITYHRRNDNLFDGVYEGEGLLIWEKSGSRIDLKCGGEHDAKNRDHLDIGKKLGGLPSDFWGVKGGTFFSRLVGDRNKATGNLVYKLEIGNITAEANRVSFHVVLKKR